MADYDPRFWEIAVDPEVLDRLEGGDDPLAKLLEGDGSSEIRARKREQALEQIHIIIATRLTELQRQVVTLYFLEGRSQAEIATKLGVRQQVVSKHLFGAVRQGRRVGGAIEKLRKLCSASGIGPDACVKELQSV
jgi:RNA polymerase sigma factor (sigma-70 family)